MTNVILRSNKRLRSACAVAHPLRSTGLAALVLGSCAGIARADCPPQFVINEASSPTGSRYSTYVEHEWWDALGSNGARGNTKGSHTTINAVISTPLKNTSLPGNQNIFFVSVPYQFATVERTGGFKQRTSGLDDIQAGISMIFTQASRTKSEDDDIPDATLPAVDSATPIIFEGFRGGPYTVVTFSAFAPTGNYRERGIGIGEFGAGLSVLHRRPLKGKSGSIYFGSSLRYSQDIRELRDIQGGTVTTINGFDTELGWNLFAGTQVRLSNKLSMLAQLEKFRSVNPGNETGLRLTIGPGIQIANTLLQINYRKDFEMDGKPEAISLGLSSPL